MLQHVTPLGLSQGIQVRTDPVVPSVPLVLPSALSWTPAARAVLMLAIKMDLIIDLQ